MILRSLDSLDLPLAWKRVIWWARERMDLPDRLPFEILARVDPDRISLESDRHLAPVDVVMATKADGTVRPFARLHPIDHVMYQALVDHAGPAIEEALAGRDVVFGYRQYLGDSSSAFKESTVWRDFAEAASAALDDEDVRYALKTDISSYFQRVDPAEVERLLLASQVDPDVARDLGELLTAWQLAGIRGLPQGPAASSPIANLYLSPLDRTLADGGRRFVRYVDDLWVFASSYAEARQIQDEIERHLYSRGLSLAGGKTQIYGEDKARTRLRTARDRFTAHRVAIQEGVEALAAEEYVDSDELPDAAEVDEAAAIALYEEVMVPFRAGLYPEDLRPTLRETFRQLSAVRSAHAIADVADVITRCPDLTRDAIKYDGYASETDADRAAEALSAVLQRETFHREQEQLHICRGDLFYGAAPSPDLARFFEDWASTSPYPLVQARSLLAWGYLSAPDAVSAADEFWKRVRRRWRSYAIIAIQGKNRDVRDELYDRWRGASRGLDLVIEQVEAGPFSWRRI